MNLCLGTVQFGMDYGISGSKRPLLAESVAMLDYAFQNGIDTFDTASAYGLAEEIIGVWLAKNAGMRNKVKLISKGNTKEDLLLSLSRMGVDFLDAYLLHSAKNVFDDEIISELSRLKKEGYVREIGVSVYETAEAKQGIAHPEIDLIQLPYNLLDHRMRDEGVFALAKEAGCALHARSAFVQGLIFSDEQRLPDFLQKARPVLRDIDAICKNAGLSRIQLALGYVKQEENISHLVFGVDCLEQLGEIIRLFNQDIDPSVIHEVSVRFNNLDRDIFMPNLWKR